MRFSEHLATWTMMLLCGACSAAAGDNKVSFDPPDSGQAGSTSSGAGGSSAGTGLALGGSSGVSLGGSLTSMGGETSSAAQTCDGKLIGYVRDFSAKTHPDFEPENYAYPNRVPGKTGSAHEENIVAATLGP